jgi:thiol-disulfide isomerase/thioredoxin
MLKPFVSNSMAEIEQGYQGQPFILSFWSIDCPPCIKELHLFQQQLQDYPETRIVLVSTDSLSDSPQVRDTLKKFSLHNIDNWIFAEEFIARLRHQVDPLWSGRIPQTYFYTRDQQRNSVTGALHAQHFEEWRLQD